MKKNTCKRTIVPIDSKKKDVIALEEDSLELTLTDATHVNDPEKSVSNGGSLVKVGDVLTYTISYTNVKKESVYIQDPLPCGVDFVSASANGTYNHKTHTVTWAIPSATSEREGGVYVTVKVNASANVVIENQGRVQVGAAKSKMTNKVENRVDSGPPIQEVSNEGKAVQVGELVTYTISYSNDERETVPITIKDKLPAGVDFVSATNNGVFLISTRNVMWTLTHVPSGSKGTVSVTVRLNDEAIFSIENQATVQVGINEPKLTNKVKNLVDLGDPEKTVFNNGALVREGDVMAYGINYCNDELEAATIVIRDQLPLGVDFVSASLNGAYDDENHVVTWTLDEVLSGQKGTAYVTVRVNKDAIVMIENKGTVQIGDSAPRMTNVVENPVDSGNPVIIVSNGGASVQAGDVMAYGISYCNDEREMATIRIQNMLPTGVDFVSASLNGVYDHITHSVIWRLTEVPSGQKRNAYVMVKVSPDVTGVLKSQAIVQVGDKNPKTTNVIENIVEV